MTKKTNSRMALALALILTSGVAYGNVPGPSIPDVFDSRFLSYLDRSFEKYADAQRRVNIPNLRKAMADWAKQAGVYVELYPQRLQPAH